MPGGAALDCIAALSMALRRAYMEGSSLPSAVRTLSLTLTLTSSIRTRVRVDSFIRTVVV